MSVPDPAASRAVLIGASRYDLLEPLPAVENNLSRLTELLTDSDVWGLPHAHVATLLNPSSRDDALDVIHDAASEASDAIFVSFAGHGLLDHSNSALHLALPRASAVSLHRALRYDDLRREIIMTCHARSKVVVLDCCFSGKAMDGFMAASLEMADQAGIEGTYLMTASAETALALAVPGEPYTAFTGELVYVIEQGLPYGPVLLDMGTLYSQVRASLLAKGRPEPQERARNDGRSIALLRNRWTAHAVGDTAQTVEERHETAGEEASTLIAPPPPAAAGASVGAGAGNDEPRTDTQTRTSVAEREDYAALARPHPVPPAPPLAPSGDLQAWPAATSRFVGCAALCGQFFVCFVLYLIVVNLSRLNSFSNPWFQVVIALVAVCLMAGAAVVWARVAAKRRQR